MKVLHLVATSGGWGGLENIVCTLAEEQARQGLDVLVAGNVEVVARLPEGRGRCFDFSKSRLSPTLLLSLRRLIREEGITVLHAHANKGAALAGLLRKVLPGLVTVATVHNTKKRVSMFRGHDAVTAVSRMAAEALTPIASQVVRNGLPLPREEALPKGLPPRQARKILLGAFGRLVPAKGFDLLIPLLKDLPEVELWLLGEGADEQKLRSLAEQYGVANRVWFGGFRMDAPEVMKQVDLFVMPSRHEGFPLTLIEMLHRQVPLVATRVAGAEEVLPLEVTCATNDPVALLERIGAAVRDLSAWRQGLEDSFEVARRELTIEHCAEEYQLVYQEALQAREASKS